MKVHVIKDVDGNVLYQRKSLTKKALIQKLVAEGKSLARADLSGQNLAHINIEGGDFSYANFDGADMRGANAKKSNFHGSSMRGVMGAGMTGVYSDFTDADMSRHPRTKVASNFSGGFFTYAKMDRSKQDYANFSDCPMSSSTMVGMKSRRATYDRATMHNVDWVDASVVACSLKEAIMRPTIRKAAQHMPDRTKGATIVGNDMSRAEIGEGNSGFVIDAKIGKASRALTWGGVSATFFMAGMHLPLEIPVEELKGFAGTGLGFIAVATGSALFKEYIEDFFKDGLFEWVSDINVKVRRGISELIKRGKSLSSLVVGFMSPQHADNIQLGLRDPEKTPFQRFKAAVTGEVEVVICDRKHLAEALARTTDAQVGRFRPNADLILTRVGAPDKAPRSLVLRRDGTSEAIWAYPGQGTCHQRWDKNGEPLTEAPGAGWNFADQPRHQLMDSFMRMMLHDTNLPELDFDSSTHTIRHGKDNSIVVVRRVNGRLHNSLGPVVVTPKDESIYLGVEFTEQPEGQSTPPAFK